MSRSELAVWRPTNRSTVTGFQVGRIVETFGEVPGRKQGPVSVSLKLHAVASPDHPTPDVGLELVARSFASYQMMPIRLRRAEAQELLRLLQRAIDATA